MTLGRRRYSVALTALSTVPVLVLLLLSGAAPGALGPMSPAVVGLPSGPSPSPAAGHVPIGSRPDSIPPSAAFTLTSSGVTPAAISLGWTEGATFLFENYTIADSSTSAAGPFQTVGVVTTDTTLGLAVAGLSPGQSYWWKVTDNTAIGGAETSNVLEVVQPTLAYLTATPIVSDSTTLSWTNNASYGGLLSFAEYRVYASVDGASPSLLATITTVATKNYTDASLAPATSYSFSVNTTDCYTGCGTGTPTVSTTQSNLVTLGTPLTLTTTISANRPAIDAGQTDQFTCTPSGGKSPFVFEWNVSGAGFVAGNSTESFAFPTVGSASAECEANDSDHDLATSAITITVNPAPGLLVALNRTTADIGQSVAFNCTVLGGTPPIVASWSFGDGEGLLENVTTHTYTTPGTYEATCRASDGAGAVVASSVEVEISPTLTAAISVSSLAAAPGTSLSFTALPSNGSGVYGGFAWNFGDQHTATGRTAAQAFAVAGHYSVTVRLNDSNGAVTTAATTVVVEPIVVSVGAIPSSTGTGTLLTFTARASGGAGGPYNYTWTFGDGSVAYGNVSTHRYTTGGSYSPTLTVTDRLGATNSSTLPSVSVTAPPPAYSWLTGWLPLLLAVLLGALIALVVYARRRSRESTASERVSTQMFPVDPRTAVSGTKVCRSCGTQNVALRTTCFHCGANLPKIAKT
jgi:hypothetical protein